MLFVCTGNTCRSPMAEAIARKISIDENFNIEVGSRGISVFSKSKASSNAIKVMSERGISLESHVSRQIMEEDLDNYDLILTMTNLHKMYLLEIKKIKNVFVIPEYAERSSSEIIDPFGGNLEVYKKCADELEDYILKIFDKITKELDI